MQRATTPVSLQRLIYRNYLKSALIPMLAIEIVLLTLYFSINLYISSRNQATLLQEVQNNLLTIITSEAHSINTQLGEVAHLTGVLQRAQETFFAHPDGCRLPNGPPRLERHPNGAYYKTEDNGGASLYYAATTPIGEAEQHKALCSEELDPLFQAIVETNLIVTQAYLNTADAMNRLYPFLHDAAALFGPSWDVNELTFYYEADAAHNPQRQAVWTSAYLDPAGAGWVISSIAPIYRGDVLEGVTGLDVTIDKLIRHVLDLDLSWDATPFLIDRDGTILAMPPRIEQVFGLRELLEHDYTAPLGMTHSKPDAYNILRSKNPNFRTGMLEFFSSGQHLLELQIGKTQYVLLQQHISQTGWRLMVLVNQSRILAPITALRDLSNRIGYAAIGVLIGFYIGFFLVLLMSVRRLADRIVSPLQALSAATSNLGQRLDQRRLQPVGIEEVDQLSHNFNEMTSALDERTTQLIAAELARQAKERETRTLTRMANTDLLTEVYNRRKIETVLNRLINNLNTTGEPFGLILCDIDHFKSVNDQYGHLAGDQVLIELSRLLRAQLRRGDAVGRWGGEEFMIVCPYIDQMGAEQTAEKLRSSIAEHTFSMVGTATASFGVALAQRGEAHDALVERADAALYAAKAAGRNCVRLSV
ncbi:diguanylate cyclase (GGDEF) domain-containing protein [Allochromatium warmingii]|uniref:diguanylate cyclase n=1 Tax=Allochromatium warmingii TaxID=61595 RepID=A0A1H3GTJ5_ALLWA|nr:diguanylate cyclase [Allochromatium warmingii]SDY06591.1 diguanylate cyclase (GGDEF) domain-containing protein [Allochromatium warmingii]